MYNLCMEIIEGLPAYLKNVPRGPTGPDDPLRDQRIAEWNVWSVAIRQHRLDTLLAVKENPKLAEIERRKCALDPAYFLVMYGYLYEPRKGSGRGGYNPWVPFEKQVQLVRWFQACMAADDEKADGMISKCRDVGMSWLMMLLFLWAWLFTEPFNGLLISWKELFVDSRAPKSLFWKLDKLLAFLPNYLKPRGFVPSKHRIKLYLENPENGNTIAGESTTSNAGRGDRITAAFLDEAAQIPGLMDVWTGLADSTEHRFAGSTESLEQGTDFIDLRTGAESEYTPSVFIIDWWDHPLHDDAWYDRQKKRYAADPDGFEREIHRNPYVASQYVYPTVREKFPEPDLFWMPGNPLFVGIDPGFDDSCALAFIQYNVAAERYEVLNGYTNRKMLADFYIPFLTGSMTDLEGNDLDEQYRYTDYERELVAWAESVNIRDAKFIGDLYGDNQSGAAADTWYGVWRKLGGIAVNRDRLPNGKAAAARMQARTLSGRRKALRWILPKLVFGDSVGARQVHMALANNVFDTNNTDRIPERGMRRDGTTHYTSAVEYWAANMYLQSELLKFNASRNQNRVEQDREMPELRSRLQSISPYGVVREVG